ncbi:brahma-associated protein of 60 kDa-like isoform X2 [Limulus polyphemus]|uniref:Brahma-associated protein of 60 kDa-like isoform X2 n=1 Tax=Limulus polyphemus TaxID=6850 RepID=A0ABM1SUU3_LIMPO|nr:brahma-associated protein of 60 kDa-like isoform X2 [Limulus polyphemus]
MNERMASCMNQPYPAAPPQLGPGITSVVLGPASYPMASPLPQGSTGLSPAPQPVSPLTSTVIPQPVGPGPVLVTHGAPTVRSAERPIPMKHASPALCLGYPPGSEMGMQDGPSPLPRPPQSMSSHINQGLQRPHNPGRIPHQGSMGIDSSHKHSAGDRASESKSQGLPISEGGSITTVPSVTRSTSVAAGGSSSGSSKKKKKLADKILSQKVQDLVPESQAYMDLLAFERKLDFTIMRKQLDIQEAFKRPMKQKHKLRIFISNTFYRGKPEGECGEEPTVPSWELRVEGRLLDDPSAPKSDQKQVKRKFSSFFKSLVIELDKDLYGPDNHLVEWHRMPKTTETDGFQVKRPGDKNVRCTILLLLDYKPLQFKLDPRLARLLGIHTQTRPVIINALWHYIKSHRLQDIHEREYINCGKYLGQIFQCPRLKFAEIPQRLHRLLHPPEPIVINHLIRCHSPLTLDSRSGLMNFHWSKDVLGRIGEDSVWKD